MWPQVAKDSSAKATELKLRRIDGRARALPQEAPFSCRSDNRGRGVPFPARKFRVVDPLEELAWPPPPPLPAALGLTHLRPCARASGRGDLPVWPRLESVNSRMQMVTQWLAIGELDETLSFEATVQGSKVCSGGSLWSRTAEE